MREIKFRAWDKKYKQWVTDMTSMTICDGWTWQTDFDDHNENIELTQFTGLKDKNGKEIFEGDILTGGSWETLYISYFDDVGAFGCIGSKFSWPNMIGYKNTEVVGNIYEISRVS